MSVMLVTIVRLVPLEEDPLMLHFTMVPNAQLVTTVKLAAQHPLLVKSVTIQMPLVSKHCQSVLNARMESIVLLKLSPRLICLIAPQESTAHIRPQQLPQPPTVTTVNIVHLDLWKKFLVNLVTILMLKANQNAQSAKKHTIVHLNILLCKLVSLKSTTAHQVTYAKILE